MLGSDLPLWPNIWLFLWCLSVCHFCQLPSVSDSLSAAIFSQGKSSLWYMGNWVHTIPTAQAGSVWAPHLWPPHIRSHSAGACSHNQVHNFAPGSSLLPFRMAGLLICLCYAICLKHCTFRCFPAPLLTFVTLGVSSIFRGPILSTLLHMNYFI